VTVHLELDNHIQFSYYYEFLITETVSL